MKTLYHSLLDYELALLQAIAECRAIPLKTLSQAEAVQQLTETMLSPAIMAITLADLSPPELAALRFMVDQGGQTDIAPFTRQYGIVRSMGAARLSREKPWLEPISPMERLWYKGLIYRMFRVTQHGGLEIIYIPQDILPLLKLYLHTDDAAAIPSSESRELTPSAPPVVEFKTTGRLREQLFNLLSYCQNTPLRPEEFMADKKELVACLLPPLAVTSMSLELEFLRHYVQLLRFTEVQKRRIRPHHETTRQWLEADPISQQLLVPQAWRSDKTRNDLWHVPSLKPQPTGWENDPVLGRSRILARLTELPPETWFNIAEFVQFIKQVEPDFQRPQGNYDSWYIQDEHGLFLMGFANWDKVEGAFIRYLLTHVLPWLSLVDLGASAANEAPTHFRLNALGQMVLHPPLSPLSQGGQKGGSPDSGGSSESSPPIRGGESPLQLSSDFQIHVPHAARLYDRFQVSRFANFHRREAELTSYYLTPTSLQRGLEQGITIRQIMAFLARATAQPLPDLITNTLHHWANRRGTIKLEQVVLLRLPHEQAVNELRQYVGLEHLLQETLNPTTIAISPEDAAAVRHILTELGYL